MPAKIYVKTGRLIAPLTKDHVVSVAADQPSCVVLAFEKHIFRELPGLSLTKHEYNSAS
jgi:hypothetical protein